MTDRTVPALRSMPPGRATGVAGGLAFTDGLVNVVSGMGTGKDKNFFNRWDIARSGQGNQAEWDVAYETSALVRKAHDIPPSEMTKAWRKWEGKPAQVEALEDAEKTLGVRDKVKRALSIARQRGGAALILGLPGNPQNEAPKAVTTGGLKYIHIVSRDQLVVEEFETDLLSPYFREPKRYTLNTTAKTAHIHPSRVIPFPGLPVPHRSAMSTDSREFWGAPLMESINDAITQATMAPAVISSLLHELKTDYINIPGLMAQIATEEYEGRLTKRLQIAALMKSMFNITILDGGDPAKQTPGGGEEWDTRQLSLTGMSDTAMLFYQILAGHLDMPLTRLIGQSPKGGLGATGDHDEANFRSSMKSAQDNDLRPRLERLDPFLIGSALGSVPKEAKWTFNPLSEPTDAEVAESDASYADTYAVLQTSGLFQNDALAKTAVAYFDGRKAFPGLAKNVAASTEDLPANKPEPGFDEDGKPIPAEEPQGQGGNSKGQSKAKKSAANDNPAHDITVNGPGGLSIKAKVRPRDAATIHDSTPRPLYVSRKIMNPQEILNWARDNGIPNLEAAGDLHVTVTFSREAVDWMAMGSDWSGDEKGQIRLPAGGPRELSLFGPLQNILVLEFVADQLQWRHDGMIAKGASWDWDEYKPHITLAKDIPQDFDLTAIKPYGGRILLGPERFEALDA